MAICPDCGMEAGDQTASCTREHFSLGNSLVPRIRYGDERRSLTWYEFEDRCDDCGVETGGVHHRDCAIEQCPLCGDYAAVCYCWNTVRRPG